MAYRGYHFFIDDLELPYAPSELKISISSNNKTVNLISGEEINLLKSPKLTEIAFDIELPRGRQYSFANKLQSPIKFTDYFEGLLTSKRPAKLIITRPLPNGGYGTTVNGFASNNWTVSLESYDWKESAENAFDITLSLKFKQYVSYGTIKRTVINEKKATVKETAKDTSKGSNNKDYTVKKGDCLWKISKKFYGTGTKWKKIYNANKTIIEKTARKYGKKDSSNGHWIYPNTKLVIPDVPK